MDVRDGAAAPGPGRILYRDVYGRSEQAGLGRYRLTEKGLQALVTFTRSVASGASALGS